MSRLGQPSASRNRSKTGRERRLSAARPPDILHPEIRRLISPIRIVKAAEARGTGILILHRDQAMRVFADVKELQKKVAAQRPAPPWFMVRIVVRPRVSLRIGTLSTGRVVEACSRAGADF